MVALRREWRSLLNASEYAILAVIFLRSTVAQPEDDDEPPQPEALDQVDLLAVLGEDVVSLFAIVAGVVFVIPVVRYVYYKYATRAVAASANALQEARSKMSSQMSILSNTKAGSMLQESMSKMSNFKKMPSRKK